jgi:hypothetical protein
MCSLDYAFVFDLFATAVDPADDQLLNFADFWKLLFLGDLGDV